MRTSALRGALRCAAPAAAWRHSEACCSAALGGARWYSVALGGAQRPRRRGCARQHVAQQRSAALGGTQRRSAALGARGSTAVLGSVVAQVRRSDTGARRRAVALGGTPYRVVRTSPVARHAAGSPHWCRSRASPGRRSLFPSRILGPLPCTVLGSAPCAVLGSAPMHGPRVRSSYSTGCKPATPAAGCDLATPALSFSSFASRRARRLISSADARGFIVRVRRS